MKTTNKILLWLTLTWAILCGWDLSAQTEKTTKDVKKNLIELLDNSNIDQQHEQIIKSKISDLIAKYWAEEAQDIIRKHALLEINKYKQWERYKSNTILTDAAQNHANDMSENNYFKHKNLKGQEVWDRVDRIWWYNYQSLSENISFRDNIEDVIFWYTKWQITEHDEIFSWTYEDIWIWISLVQDTKWQWRGLYYFVFNFWKQSK